MPLMGYTRGPAPTEMSAGGLLLQRLRRLISPKTLVECSSAWHRQRTRCAPEGESALWAQGWSAPLHRAERGGRPAVRFARACLRQGRRALNLINPWREPCVLLAAFLTLVEAAGQGASRWLIIAIALGNLLAVYLIIWLAELAGAAGVLLLRALLGQRPEDASAGPRVG